MQLEIMLTLAAVLGAGIIAGVFFAFSTFVMQALARRPTAEGTAAMQAINETVINPWFLGVFMGMTVVSVALAALAVLDWRAPVSTWLVAGAFCYVVGTFGVTAAGNIPLNNELAEVTAGTQEADATWLRYLTRWTRWNHMRTLGAAAATAFYALALVAAT